MSNLSRLTDAGLIASNASFSEADQAVINSLSEDEVSALISISQKVPKDFLQRHCTSGAGIAAAAGPGQSVGIVF